MVEFPLRPYHQTWPLMLDIGLQGGTWREGDKTSPGLSPERGTEIKEDETTGETGEGLTVDL